MSYRLNLSNVFVGIQKSVSFGCVIFVKHEIIRILGRLINRRFYHRLIRSYLTRRQSRKNDVERFTVYTWENNSRHTKETISNRVGIGKKAAATSTSHLDIYRRTRLKNCQNVGHINLPLSDERYTYLPTRDSRSKKV